MNQDRCQGCLKDPYPGTKIATRTEIITYFKNPLSKNQQCHVAEIFNEE